MHASFNAFVRGSRSIPTFGLFALMFALGGAAGCGDDDDDGSTGAGGKTGSGGTAAVSGGRTGQGGTTTESSGGAPQAGTASEHEGGSSTVEPGSGGAAESGAGGASAGAPAITSPAHWTYEGEDGPEHWAELSDDYAMCAEGKKQSPVDFPSSPAPGALEGLEFTYSEAPAALLDNGHTVQVNFTGGKNSLHVAGEDFQLVQFHFHAHAEHTVGGADPSPMELHLVHKSAAGHLAVVGVFLEIGAENAALAAVFSRMSDATATAEALDDAIDPSALLPDKLTGWAYSGSLTTPPCSEGVNWHVYSTPLEISEEQLQAFTSRHDPSFRPTQPLNSRLVSFGDLPHFEYEGDEGPEHWGDLSPGTAKCGTGKEQSPIDIPDSVDPAPLEGLSFDYSAAPGSIYDNGHTVQVNFTGGTNHITLGGKDYSLLQFHFHKHSEHTVAGESHALEAHLVHQASDGARVVIGTFFDSGTKNSPLAEVFDDMASATDVPAPLSEHIDPADLLPSATDGWSYAGSLTTPPCSEGVTWILYSTVQTVSTSQLAAFLHDPSFRPAQPLNGREILGGI